jgi:hypothetical protein
MISWPQGLGAKADGVCIYRTANVTNFNDAMRSYLTALTVSPEDVETLNALIATARLEILDAYNNFLDDKALCIFSYITNLSDAAII